MKTIMLVDAVAVMRIQLSDILKKSGYEIVAEATNGIEACRKYEEFKPDLLIMELSLSKVEGYEDYNINSFKVMKWITNKYPDAKIIICSAICDVLKVVEAIDCGAKDFIAKPVEPKRLIDSIRKLEVA